MAKLTEEIVLEAFRPTLQEGEVVTHFAIGFKQPNMFLIFLLMMLGIIPGLIVMVLLSKYYCVGLTDKRFIVLQIQSQTNLKLKVITEYSLKELKGMDISTSTGVVFTHIKIKNKNKPFRAKFHRALAKFNRPNAIAIAETISKKAA